MFKGMPLVQYITGYIDYKNLMQDALGFTLDQVYHWTLLLDEYGPTFMCIKGIHNMVVHVISCLDYFRVTNDKATCLVENISNILAHVHTMLTMLAENQLCHCITTVVIGFMAGSLIG